MAGVWLASASVAAAASGVKRWRSRKLSGRTSSDAATEVSAQHLHHLHHVCSIACCWHKKAHTPTQLSCLEHYIHYGCIAICCHRPPRRMPMLRRAFPAVKPMTTSASEVGVPRLVVRQEAAMDE